MQDASLGNLSLLIECVGGKPGERAYADEPAAEAVFRGLLVLLFSSLLLRGLLRLLLLGGKFLPQAVQDHGGPRDPDDHAVEALSQQITKRASRPRRVHTTLRCVVYLTPFLPFHSRMYTTLCISVY